MSEEHDGFWATREMLQGKMVCMGDGSHAACWMCDFDDDWDVDQADFGVLQRLMQ